jgi:excisionase family DNA binding protein
MRHSRFCLSIKEAQGFLGVSRSTLQRYIKKGVMTYGKEYTKLGKYLFDPQELEKWLELRPQERGKRRGR